MEKLAYQLWKKDDANLETFKELLLKNLSKDIGELVSELQINIADADVLPANNLAQSNYPPCLLYTSPSPRDLSTSRMPSSA